jgi:hypothetical protein
VRMTEVPRANSSATLSAWMWYPSAAESGLGTATNWWRYVSIVLHKVRVSIGSFGTWRKTDILEQAQHLVISGVVWNEESNISIPQHCSDSDQASSSAGHYADILPGVLTFLALPVVVVV